MELTASKTRGGAVKVPGGNVTRPWCVFSDGKSPVVTEPVAICGLLAG